MGAFHAAALVDHVAARPAFLAADAVSAADAATAAAISTDILGGSAVQ